MGKEEIQETILKVTSARFKQHRDLMDRLKVTGKREIIYDTTSGHDNLLGWCRCKECREKKHLNLYGKALMKTRDV